MGYPLSVRITTWAVLVTVINQGFLGLPAPIGARAAWAESKELQAAIDKDLQDFVDRFAYVQSHNPDVETIAHVVENGQKLYVRMMSAHDPRAETLESQIVAPLRSTLLIHEKLSDDSCGGQKGLADQTFNQMGQNYFQETSSCSVGNNPKSGFKVPLQLSKKLSEITQSQNMEGLRDEIATKMRKQLVSNYYQIYSTYEGALPTDPDQAIRQITGGDSLPSDAELKETIKKLAARKVTDEQRKANKKNLFESTQQGLAEIGQLSSAANASDQADRQLYEVTENPNAGWAKGYLFDPKKKPGLTSPAGPLFPVEPGRLAVYSLFEHPLRSYNRTDVDVNGYDNLEAAYQHDQATRLEDYQKKYHQQVNAAAKDPVNLYSLRDYFQAKHGLKVKSWEDPHSVKPAAVPTAQEAEARVRADLAQFSSDFTAAQSSLAAVSEKRLANLAEKSCSRLNAPTPELDEIIRKEAELRCYEDLKNGPKAYSLSTRALVKSIAPGGPLASGDGDAASDLALVQTFSESARAGQVDPHQDTSRVESSLKKTCERLSTAPNPGAKLTSVDIAVYAQAKESCVEQFSGKSEFAEGSAKQLLIQLSQSSDPRAVAEFTALNSELENKYQIEASSNAYRTIADHWLESVDQKVEALIKKQGTTLDDPKALQKIVTESAQVPFDLGDEGIQTLDLAHFVRRGNESAYQQKAVAQDKIQQNNVLLWNTGFKDKYLFNGAAAPIKESEMQKSLNGFFKSTRELLSGFAAQDGKIKGDPAQQIKSVISRDPGMLPEILAAHPEYSELVCSLSRQVINQGANDAFWDKTIMMVGVGALLAAATLATGGLLGPAAIAAWATLGATAATVAGTGTTLISLNHNLAVRDRALSEMRDIDNFSGALGSERDVGEYVQYEQEAQHRLNAAVADGAMTALDGLAMTKGLLAAGTKTAAEKMMSKAVKLGNRTAIWGERVKQSGGMSLLFKTATNGAVTTETRKSFQFYYEATKDSKLLGFLQPTKEVRLLNITNWVTNPVRSLTQASSWVAKKLGFKGWKTYSLHPFWGGPNGVVNAIVFRAPSRAIQASISRYLPEAVQKIGPVRYFKGNTLDPTLPVSIVVWSTALSKFDPVSWLQNKANELTEDYANEKYKTNVYVYRKTYLSLVDLDDRYASIKQAREEAIRNKEPISEREIVKSADALHQYYTKFYSAALSDYNPDRPWLTTEKVLDTPLFTHVSEWKEKYKLNSGVTDQLVLLEMQNIAGQERIAELFAGTGQEAAKLRNQPKNLWDIIFAVGEPSPEDRIFWQDQIKRFTEDKITLHEFASAIQLDLRWRVRFAQTKFLPEMPFRRMVDGKPVNEARTIGDVRQEILANQDHPAPERYRTVFQDLPDPKETE